VFLITSNKQISRTQIGIYLMYNVALLSDYVFRSLLN